MLDYLCASCEHANPAGTRVCSSCHEPLTPPSRPAPVDAPVDAQDPDLGGDGAAMLQHIPDALSGPDSSSVVPIAEPVTRLSLSSWRLDRFSTRPLDLAHDLAPDRAPDVAQTQPDDLPTAPGIGNGASAWVWGHTDANTDSEAAALLDLLDIDDSAAATWLPVAPRTPTALMNCQPVAPVTARQVHKAQRRATVRRDRLARNLPTAHAPDAPHHVLVLDTDAVARVELCALLESFGFRAHPARTTAQAQALLGLHDIEAAFLAVVLDGSHADEAAALCHSVAQASRGAKTTLTTTAMTARTATPASPAALVIVGSSARPIERVRARLAGANEFLDKPASRGNLARALDTCGVALPADPRRATA